MNMYVVLNKQCILFKQGARHGGLTPLSLRAAWSTLCVRSQPRLHRPCLKKTKEARGQQYGSVGKPDNLSLLSRNICLFCVCRKEPTPENCPLTTAHTK